MSDKSRDAEPTHDDLVSGEPDANLPEDPATEPVVDGDEHAEILAGDPVEGDVEIEDPDALAEAEADVMEMVEDETVVDDDDATIAEMEQQFDSTDSTDVAVPAIVRKTAKAPVKKSAPTKRRKDAVVEDEDHYKASNPIEFAKQSGAELKKVVWPTWPQLVTMFFAVLIFVIIIIAIVGGLDALFTWILLTLFGN
ncbi:MAG TPA: preprotein translocase subunit SecE [Tessaracoccus flavescens]|uniref:Protein translocase subunit SecE n=1 Tax=Tessaracoccus flavescens TaxID=399497 RepID=A0A921JPI8_9ACTN|nr:preprotein translocase subunit SecE [Tessaracoccus flavescens]